MVPQSDVRSYLMQLRENVLSSISKDLDQTECYDKLSPEIKEFCNIFEEVYYARKQFSKYNNSTLVVDKARFGDVVFKSVFDEMMRDVPYTKREGQFTRLNNHYNVHDDAIISFIMNDEDLRSMVVEIKSETKTTERDFMKLAVEMKVMLDSMVDRYVPDPVVFGVLVEGQLVSYIFAYEIIPSLLIAKF
ncbi:hypothetical protein INT45_002395 [Circinella minor]|uniref:Uncharacterized protein n=1 Tax=Circinella minor TaxID=1195481 RepID=A0A8H7VC53_9FUNG|nr:hypothetical protein INT45_002395 [Circinella minor]